MVATLPRALAILDELVGRQDGLALGDLAQRLDIPKSAVHRVITELVELGLVRQESSGENYILGLRIVSLALRHLRDLPLVELASPALQRLADESGELSRLSIVDGDTLVWVAKRQGARSGLRYDPDSGSEVVLATTSSGLAWLSTLADDRAIELVERQSAVLPPEAPRGSQLLRRLDEIRRAGHVYTDSTFEVGLAGVAVPIRAPGGEAIGVLSVAGPSVRFGAEESARIVPTLVDCAASLAPIAQQDALERVGSWN
jgi:IclR family acetate operon transcriptional repressor